MRSKKLKYLSSVCIALGFFIPFVASKFVGMPLGAMPIVSAANIILWIIGILLGYFAYIDLKKPSPSLPWWVKISNYIASDPSRYLMLGVMFGYLFYPSVEKSLVPTFGPYLLMVTLFSMGLAISFKDWKGMVQRPKVVGIGVLLRWLCMPFVAFLLSLVLIQLFPGATGKTLAIGLIILGTTPTGGGSNALTMISGGDLALSVSVTSINTIIAPFIQPLLILWLAGSMANLNAGAIFQDLLWMVVVPVIAGSILGSIFPKFISKIKPALGPIAVICLTFIIMGTMSKGTSTLIKQFSILLYLVVVCVIQAVAGLLLGYFLPKYFGFSYKQRKAICFEVGVENAALAMLIALRHFSPLTALPSIVYGKIQYIISSTIVVPRFQRIEDEKVIKATSAEGVRV
jgi:BASS family bile acid:Na+ symporter